MRSISFLILAGIFLFLLLMTWLSSRSLINLSSSKKIRKRIGLAYWIFSLYVISHFTYLFIYPQTAATSINYKAYFLFNVILITDLLSKFVLSASAIIFFILKKKNHSPKVVLWMGAILTFCISIIVLYGALIGRNKLQIKELIIEYQNLPQSFNGTKIVQISDIHLGSFYENSSLISRTSSAIKEINPDYIFFTGDLVNNFSYEIEPWMDELNNWLSKKGNYGILGNHDYGDYFHWNDSVDKVNNLNQIIKGHEKIGFQLLRNAHVALVSGKDSIYLIGVENWGHEPFPQYADLKKAMQGIPNEAFKILLTHDPAHWTSKIKNKEDIDLSLSGHTHGMQTGIKIAGIELSPMFLVRKQWGGLYKHDNQYLYVNRGFGTIGINWRIDMPPELTVITLKSAKINGQKQ